MKGKLDALLKAVGEPLLSATTGGQIMPFEREMCFDIVSLNLQLCYDSLLLSVRKCYKGRKSVSLQNHMQAKFQSSQQRINMTQCHRFFLPQNLLRAKTV